MGASAGVCELGSSGDELLRQKKKRKKKKEKRKDKGLVSKRLCNSIFVVVLQHVPTLFALTVMITEFTPLSFSPTSLLQIGLNRKRLL